MDILIEELEGSLWAAAVDKGRLEGLEIDPAFEEVRWGSVYWARVKTVDAALDAVFLDLDGENTGILYNADVRLRARNGTIHKGGDKAIGKTLKPGQMIAVQAKSAYIASPGHDKGGGENKIPQLSMDITIPGRYLIVRGLAADIQVSHRIREKKLREQIRKALTTVMDDCGFIARSAAAGVQTEMLLREGKLLKAAWRDMSRHLRGNLPTLVMLGPDAMQRTLSDKASQHIERIELASMDQFGYVEEWCSLFAPDLVTKIMPLTQKKTAKSGALFHSRDLMRQMEDLLQPYMLLPGGGSILIQETAALTAIDVNKGAARGANLAVNIEAAQEIARQVRLRNIGGILMIDFLKFQTGAERKKLAAALEAAFQNDPATVQIHGFTAIGLAEITRNRRTPSLHQRLEGVIDA